MDTAALYGNEKDVGEAVRDSGLPREELWITTKLWDSDHGYKQAMSACHTSAKKLGLGYIDLYLRLVEVELQHRQQGSSTSG